MCRWRISFASLEGRAHRDRDQVVLGHQLRDREAWCGSRSAGRGWSGCPTSFGPTVTGTPLMRYFAIRSSASATGASGATVTGSTIMPDSERLTLSTSAAWASIVMFLWMKPMPALLGEGDREVGLGDRVHGRGDDGDLEGDRLR